MLSMPPAIAGGVLALRGLNLFTTQAMDLLTTIGFLILLGLVVNNAILLVMQARVGMRSGLDRAAAVAEAVRVRARPIYLSTLTSIFGMMPLMLIPGVGSQIYRGLATVIIGGQRRIHPDPDAERAALAAARQSAAEARSANRRSYCRCVR
jgi:HAE1 family hydrophobic/amphiphilic exporter-1